MIGGLHFFLCKIIYQYMHDGSGFGFRDGGLQLLPLKWLKNVDLRRCIVF